MRRVVYANPLALVRRRHPRQICFARDTGGAKLGYFGPQGEPEAHWLCNDFGLVIQCIQICLSVPVPLCKSLYSGAMYGRKCGHVLVAHIKRPNAASSFLQGTFLPCARRLSCSLSFSSFGAGKCSDSVAKSKDHPHQVALQPVCAFFHDTGALRMVRKATVMHVACLCCALRNRSSKSSTYSHAVAKLAQQAVHASD